MKSEIGVVLLIIKPFDDIESKYKSNNYKYKYVYFLSVWGVLQTVSEVTMHNRIYSFPSRQAPLLGPHIFESPSRIYSNIN